MKKKIIEDLEKIGNDKVNKTKEHFLDWIVDNVGITRSEIDKFGKKVLSGEIDIDNKLN